MVGGGAVTGGERVSAGGAPGGRPAGCPRSEPWDRRHGGLRVTDEEKDAGEKEYGEDHTSSGLRDREPEDSRPYSEPVEKKADDEDEVAESGQDKKEEGPDRFDVFHEAGMSLLLTVAIVVVMGLCLLRAGSIGWLRLTVFGSGYAVLFSICWFLVKRSSGEPPDEPQVRKGDIRIVAIVAGFAATVFGTPAFLDMAPDFLAVVGALGGADDGALVGWLARHTGVSGVRAVWLALWEEKPEKPT